MTKNRTKTRKARKYLLLVSLQRDMPGVPGRYSLRTLETAPELTRQKMEKLGMVLAARKDVIDKLIDNEYPSPGRAVTAVALMAPGFEVVTLQKVHRAKKP